MNSLLELEAPNNKYSIFENLHRWDSDTLENKYHLLLCLEAMQEYYQIPKELFVEITGIDLRSSDNFYYDSADLEELINKASVALPAKDTSQNIHIQTKKSNPLDNYFISNPYDNLSFMY